MTVGDWIAAIGVAITALTLMGTFFGLVGAKIRRVHARIDEVQRDLHSDHITLRREMSEGFNRVSDRVDRIIEGRGTGG